MRINLKKVRQNKGFTQAQIAKLSNISERQYRRIELEEQTPSIEVALLIADALEIENVKSIFPLPQRQLRESQPDGNPAIEKNVQEKNNMKEGRKQE